MVGVCGFLHGFPYFGAIEISDSTIKLIIIYTNTQC